MVGGMAGWLLARWRKGPARPRLELVERIALGPRQWLSLIEAEGRRVLVATSAEGGPAFYALNEEPSAGAGSKRPRATRVSW